MHPQRLHADLGCLIRQRRCHSGPYAMQTVHSSALKRARSTKTPEASAQGDEAILQREASPVGGLCYTQLHSVEG